VRATARNKVTDNNGLEQRHHPPHLVGTKEACAADGRHRRKEDLGISHLLAKQVEGVWQSMADRPAQLTQAKALKEDLKLISHSGGPVMAVAVVEGKTGIQPNTLHARRYCQLNLT
jgi:hypothetical protein